VAALTRVSCASHDLHQIVRVLKPGGRSLITFLLLNEESLALMRERKASFNFEHEMPDYRMIHFDNPEAAIAYPEDFVMYLYGRAASSFGNRSSTVRGAAERTL
jgi:hypothetical protein